MEERRSTSSSTVFASASKLCILRAVFLLRGLEEGPLEMYGERLRWESLVRCIKEVSGLLFLSRMIVLNRQTGLHAGYI